MAGITAHLLAFGVWVARPDIVWKYEKQLLTWLQQQGFRLPATGPVPDKEKDLRSALPAWQPDSRGALAEREIRVSGVPVENLPIAARKLQDGDTLELGPGIYRKGVVLKASGLTVRGRGHVIFDDAAVKGKGALVIRGDNTRVINIECRNVQVADRNGSCIRLEGRDLTVRGVYFHDSEQGILTGSAPGRVTIENSRFEMLGKNGRAHGIYIGGGDLVIRGSLFLSSVSEAHEIKSRAESTHIERSIIASLGGKDSRLLDISNGGELIVRNSVLQEGPASVNSDLIGFGLEKKKLSGHRAELTNNIILLEGPGRNRLLHQINDASPPTMRGNVIIGTPDAEYSGMNIWLTDRKEAGLPPYPALPSVPGS